MIKLLLLLLLYIKLYLGRSQWYSASLKTENLMQKEHNKFNI